MTRKFIFDFKIEGIPCQIRIDKFKIVDPWPGPPSTAPSADDYYGYTEIEYTILDRKGYPAAWLERKLTREIEREIEAYVQGN